MKKYYLSCCDLNQYYQMIGDDMDCCYGEIFNSSDDVAWDYVFSMELEMYENYKNDNNLCEPEIVEQHDGYMLIKIRDVENTVCDGFTIENYDTVKYHEYELIEIQ